MRHLKYFENVNSKIELLKDILQEISDEQEFININVFDYSDKNGEAYNIIIGIDLHPDDDFIKLPIIAEKILDIVIKELNNFEYKIFIGNDENTGPTGENELIEINKDISYRMLFYGDYILIEFRN